MDNINQNPAQLSEEKKSHFPNKANLRLILSRISFITLLILVIILYIQLNAEQAKRHLLEKTLQEISSAKDILDKELGDTTNLMKETSNQINNLKKELDAQIKEKEELIKERGKLIKEREKSEEEVNKKANLTNEILFQLKKISDQLNDVKKQLDAQIKEKAKLEEDINLIREAKETLENKIKDSIIKKEIELGKIVVSPKPKNKAGIGEVISVNRESRFVVIDSGTKDGIKKGSIFKIVRDNQVIAKVKIQKVYANTCVGEILIEEQIGNIQEGDIVAYF